MAAIRVHEFMSLDGVIDAPTWTFEYGFDPKMEEAIPPRWQAARASCSAAPPTTARNRESDAGL